MPQHTQDIIDPAARTFYRTTMSTLKQAGIPFLVGGAYAFARYTGIERHTKDFDIFVMPEDRDRVLEVLAEIGCKTECTFPHWLAKGFKDEDFIDVIYSGGNGVPRVDQCWFEYSVQDTVLDIPVGLIPAEEMIWSKSFVMERERFDGADVLHILHQQGQQLDWQRLLARFGEHWRVLFAHLVLFGYVYPSDRETIPAWVRLQLTDRLHAEAAQPPAEERCCYGPVISRAQYRIDLEQWGYTDARLQPRGSMSAEDIDHWTAAIDTIP